MGRGMAFLLNTEIILDRQPEPQKEQVMHQDILHRIRADPALAAQDAAAILEVPEVAVVLVAVVAVTVLVENVHNRKAAGILQLFCYGQRGEYGIILLEKYRVCRVYISSKERRKL